MRHKLGVEFAACFTFFSSALPLPLRQLLLVSIFSISILLYRFRFFARSNGTKSGPFVVVIIMVDLVATN